MDKPIETFQGNLGIGGTKSMASLTHKSGNVSGRTCTGCSF